MNAFFDLRAKFESEGYHVSLQVLAPGTVFGEHCACDSRIDAVLAGRLRVVVGGQSRILGPGEWIEVGAGTPMTAEVIGDEPVLALDAASD